MKIVPEADSLHRLVKQAMDSGRASTFEEAATLFEGYRLAIEIADPSDTASQAALLTAVALARRVFLGGVWVMGDLDVAQTTPLPFGPTLRDGVIALGGQIGGVENGTPRISVRHGATGRAAAFHVRTLFAGWRGGSVPIDFQAEGHEGAVMPLSPMVAAAFAVSEAYSFVSGQRAAGRRPAGVSLWTPSADWLARPDDGLPLAYLPTRLWLIGLGHLGQAYLWAIGLLPYGDAAAVRLVLQDMDVVSASSESTSILSDATMIGHRKTRAMAGWAARRGFDAVIHERLFDEDYRRQTSEPAIAMCGLDNALGRRALDKAGFDFVVEAGLGRDHRNFQTMRLHTLPGSRTAEQMWANGDGGMKVESQGAYQDLLGRGRLDQCGITLLAGKAVGAPFVGSVAACLAVSEVLRLLAGGPLHELIDLDLRAPEHILAVPQSKDFSGVNPGYAMV